MLAGAAEVVPDAVDVDGARVGDAERVVGVVRAGCGTRRSRARPGSRPVSMQLQAGTVIGGSTLRSGPQVPRSTSPRMFGSSSSQRSKTSLGSAQSRPITATRRLIAGCRPARGSPRGPRSAASACRRSAATAGPGASASAAAIRCAFAGSSGPSSTCSTASRRPSGVHLRGGQPDADAGLDHAPRVVGLVPGRRHDDERHAGLQRRR